MNTRRVNILSIVNIVLHDTTVKIAYTLKSWHTRRLYLFNKNIGRGGTEKYGVSSLLYIGNTNLLIPYKIYLLCIKNKLSL